VAEIASATDLPVNADFQDGHGATPEAVAESVRLCVQAGVSGLSIEDATDDPARPLYDLPDALERLKAARTAIDATGSGVLLTARAEVFLKGHPDPLREAIRRLEAYAAAGADVLYAPGPRTREDIRAIISAVAPKPVNVLMGWNVGLTVNNLAELGARRISVGSSLARAAWTGFSHAAKLIASEGSFAGFDGLVSGQELNQFFQAGA
jgi:2-methylisocitrate lyase-like PEP mutase family enzyme